MSMKKVIDHLIAEAPETNDGAAEVQVITTKGGMFSGAIKRSELGDDIYEIVSIGMRAGPNGQPLPNSEPFAVKIYLLADEISIVQTQMKVDPKRIITPSRGGIAIPGRG